jgi:hypothetical protein
MRGFMNIYLNSFSSYKLPFFKGSNATVFVAKQERILVIISLALACFTACLMIKKYCGYHAKTLLNGNDKNKATSVFERHTGVEKAEIKEEDILSSELDDKDANETPNERDEKPTFIITPSRSEQNYFAELPDEMMLKIFEFLDYKNLTNVSLVNRHWCSLSSDEVLWDKLCRKVFFTTGDPNEKTEDTWKLTYQFLDESYFTELHDYGTITVGSFRGVWIHGRGKITYSNGIEEGVFQKGVLIKGKRFKTSTYYGKIYADLYEGEFKDGRLYKGKQTFYMGKNIDFNKWDTAYEGEFRNGLLFNGKRITFGYQRSEEIIEEGLFQSYDEYRVIHLDGKGKRTCLHGKGCYKGSIIKEEDGQFQVGKLIRGKKTFYDSDSYNSSYTIKSEEGLFKDGRLLEGKITYSGGEVKKGKFDEFGQLVPSTCILS